MIGSQRILRALCVVGLWAGASALTPSMAQQTPAMSLAPMPSGTRAPAPLIFGSPVSVPVPVPRPPSLRPTPAKADPQDAETLQDAAEDATKTPVTAPKAGKSGGFPRLVTNIPLPPIPVRPKTRQAETRQGKAQPELAATAKAGQAGAISPPPPATQVTALAPLPSPTRSPATGIFSIFDQKQTVDTAPDESGLLRNAAPSTPQPVQATQAPSGKLAKIDLSEPLRAKKTTEAVKSTANEREDDDDAEDEDSDDDYKPGTVEKQVDSVQISCLKPNLMALIHKAGEHFGETPVITSGYRSHGRRGSLHRRCEAADIQIPGVSGREIVAFFRRLPGAGGVGTYCNTKSVHIDTGEPRDWRYCGRRRTYFALRSPVLQIVRP